MLTLTFSGCLGPDGLWSPRITPPEDQPPGIVRTWIATTPSDLPDEFAHINVTMGGTALRHSLDDKDMTAIHPVREVVDLAALRRNLQAAQVGQHQAPAASLIGVTFMFVAAEVVVRRVIGTQDGEPVYRNEHYEAAAPGMPAKLQAPFSILSGSVTDVYIELDLTKSLEVKGLGSYSLEHGVSRVSVYVDNVKLSEHDVTGRALRAEQREKYGDVSYMGQDVDRPVRKPDARLVASDPWGRDLGKWSRNGYVSRAVGLDEPIRWDATLSTYDKGASAKEVRWEFGDGTKAFGAKVTKAFDSGGIYDVAVTVRDTNDLSDTAVMTIFVPYRPDEARSSQSMSRAGTIVHGATMEAMEATPFNGTFDLQFNATLGNWTLGGYTVALETHALGDEDGLADQVMMTRLNVTTGMVDASIEGAGDLVIATAGIPTSRGTLLDWVEPLVELELDVPMGVAMTYQLVVTAHYYEPLAKGADPHGAHLHGPWRWTDPYVGYLDHEGHTQPPAGQEPAEEPSPLPV